LGKILEDLCCCATYYCDLLRHKVDLIYVAQQGEGKVFITKQVRQNLPYIYVKNSFDMRQKFPLDIRQKFPLDIRQKFPLDIRQKFPLDIRQKFPQYTSKAPSIYVKSPLEMSEAYPVTASIPVIFSISFLKLAI
jgi:hypothetical protein